MKPTYFQRLRAITWNVIVSYPRTLPESWWAVRNSFTDFVISLVVFAMNVAGLLLMLALPFLFILSPVYLWWLDSEVAKAKAQRDLDAAMEQPHD